MSPWLLEMIMCLPFYLIYLLSFVTPLPLFPMPSVGQTDLADGRTCTETQALLDLISVSLSSHTYILKFVYIFIHLIPVKFYFEWLTYRLRSQLKFQFRYARLSTTKSRAWQRSPLVPDPPPGDDSVHFVKCNYLSKTSWIKDIM